MGIHPLIMEIRFFSVKEEFNAHMACYVWIGLCRSKINSSDMGFLFGIKEKWN